MASVVLSGQAPASARQPMQDSPAGLISQCLTENELLGLLSPPQLLQQQTFSQQPSASPGLSVTGSSTDVDGVDEDHIDAEIATLLAIKQVKRQERRRRSQLLLLQQIAAGLPCSSPLPGTMSHSSSGMMLPNPALSGTADDAATAAAAAASLSLQSPNGALLPNTTNGSGVMCSPQLQSSASLACPAALLPTVGGFNAAAAAMAGSAPCNWGMDAGRLLHLQHSMPAATCGSACYPSARASIDCMVDGSCRGFAGQQGLQDGMESMSTSPFGLSVLSLEAGIAAALGSISASDLVTAAGSTGTCPDYGVRLSHLQAAAATPGNSVGSISNGDISLGTSPLQQQSWIHHQASLSTAAGCAQPSATEQLMMSGVHSLSSSGSHSLGLSGRNSVLDSASLAVQGTFDFGVSSAAAAHSALSSCGVPPSFSQPLELPESFLGHNSQAAGAQQQRPRRHSIHVVPGGMPFSPAGNNHSCAAAPAAAGGSGGMSLGCGGEAQGQLQATAESAISRSSGSFSMQTQRNGLGGLRQQHQHMQHPQRQPLAPLAQAPGGVHGPVQQRRHSIDVGHAAWWAAGATDHGPNARMHGQAATMQAAMPPAAAATAGGSSHGKQQHHGKGRHGGSRRGSLDGSKRQPIDVGSSCRTAAPKWAGTTWQPLADVLKEGNAAKGTGVFLPGVPRPAVAAADEAAAANLAASPK